MSSFQQQQRSEMDQQILTIKGLEEAVAILFQNNFDADSSTCLVTIMKILDNVLHKPGDVKVRQLRLNNAAVSQKIGQLKGGIEILKACGFQQVSQPPPLLGSAGGAGGEEMLVLHPEQEHQSVLITARRLLQTRTVQDLKMDPNLLPPYREPPPPPRFNNNNAAMSSSSSGSSGFNIYTGQRYDAKSAAVGTNLGPDANYKSKTEIALSALQQQQQKLEKRMYEQQPLERRWQAFEPVISGATPSAATSNNDDSSARGGTRTGEKGDSSLLMTRLQQQQEQRKQREEGGFTTSAMRELEKMKKQKVYSHATLTIQFPTGHYLRGQFLPKESIHKVMESMQNDCLVQDAICGNKSNTAAGNSFGFELYVTPPRQLLKLDQTLQQQGLVPAAKVFVSWKKGYGPSGNHGDPPTFLKSHLFVDETKTLDGPSISFPTAQAVAAAATEQQEREAQQQQEQQATDSKKKAKKTKADRQEEMLKRMMGGKTGGF